MGTISSPTLNIPRIQETYCPYPSSPPNEIPTPNQLAYCEWQGGGIRTTFLDEDMDAVPDEGAGARGIVLREPWDGSDGFGPGVGISPACFV